MKIPIHIVIRACLLAIISPRRYLSFQKSLPNDLEITFATNDNSAKVISRAFWMSFLFVLVSALIGAVAGFVCGHFFGAASSFTIRLIQIAGASILLWGTLFVRGWEVQTIGGHTLIELINQWIYRTIYW